MKRERRIGVLSFVVCLVVAMPSARGAGTVASSMVGKPSRASRGTRIDVSSKVTLCHIPPGDPANAQTIVVGQSAVAAHLAHGDYLGECHPACDGVKSALPKTGQTACYDESSSTIDCAGSGQDGEYQAGVSVDPRFTDNGNGTVTDKLTGLIWLQNANCFGAHLWTDALAAANSLASGSCGLTDGSVAGDWRLPNVRELQSLVDFSRFDPALPSGHPFSGVFAGGYWSSTTFAFGAQLRPQWGNAWFVDFAFGNAIGYVANADGDKQFMMLVWPIRGGR